MNYKIRTFETQYETPSINSVNLFYALDNITQKNKQLKYKEWLNKEYPSAYKIDIINSMFNDITTMLKNKGYEINHSKQFKKEFASHIYSNSNKSV